MSWLIDNFGLMRSLTVRHMWLNYPQMLSGSVLVVALALLIDAAFAGMQRPALASRPLLTPSRE